MYIIKKCIYNHVIIFETRIKWIKMATMAENYVNYIGKKVNQSKIEEKIKKELHTRHKGKIKKNSTMVEKLMIPSHSKIQNISAK